MMIIDKNNPFSFVAENNNIKVTIFPRFDDMKSKIMNQEFVWTCDVEIENNTDYIIQLLSINLQIFSKNGFKKNMVASNVIEQRPVIEPNMTLYYSEQISLPSNSGLATGLYYAIDLSNIVEIAIEIPPFSLDTLCSGNIVN